MPFISGFLIHNHQPMKTRTLLFISFCLVQVSLLQAQVDLQNGTTLYISSSSDIVYVNGNFINTSAAALTNNGSLYVRQNLTNGQASMATGTGTLYLNGTAAQAIGGTQAFRTYHLNTNNTAGITLNNNLSVSGVHTFTNGIITTSATPNYLIYEAGSSYTGDGDSRHVNGAVKKYGTTNFIFPVGNGTIERAAAVVNLSANSEINAQYLQPTPNIYNLQGPLVQVDPHEYWQIDKISGGTVQVTLNWNTAKVAFPPSLLTDIKAANYSGSLWVNAGGSAIGNPYTTGSVTSNALTTLGRMTFGFMSTPLPVDLISFTAERKNNYTQVDWKTAQEQNVDHFEVERSNNGVQFYKIAQVAARNSGNTESYSINDYEALTNIAYYRLRSIDKDGKEKLSHIVSIKAQSADNTLTLVSNPVRDQIVLAAGGTISGMFNYRIYAAGGKLMQEGSLVIRNAGQYKITLNGYYSKGVYFADVSNGLESFRYKIVVE